jgi:hypothetical protein
MKLNIDTISPVVRTFDYQDDPDELARFALLCLLGEHIDMTTFQVYWLNQVYHDRPSDQFNFREWVLQLAHAEYGLADLTTRELADERLAMNTWSMADTQRQVIRDEMTTVALAIENNLGKIERLFGMQPVGYKNDDEFGPGTELYLDLPGVTMEELVDHHIMKPITAAKFFMITRPSEHVVLTPVMLRWAARVPAVMGFQRRKRRSASPKPLPTVAPTALRQYQKFEFFVRRLQRTYFHGRTSLEAHLLIHESELAYEAQPVAYKPSRMAGPPLYFNLGGGI